MHFDWFLPMTYGRSYDKLNDARIFIGSIMQGLGFDFMFPNLVTKATQHLSLILDR